AEPELRRLVRDRDPDVRAAAITALGDRAPALLAAAASDPASQVREAVVAIMIDPSVLAQLAHDADPAIATAAIVRSSAQRGRAALVLPTCEALGEGRLELAVRVRHALGWLLAR
nr:HEAT repeat domain-containing protein [Myxococcota bacterium]